MSKGTDHCQQRYANLVTVGQRLIAVLIILGGLAVLPAFGQMGSSVTYSDTWVDDYNPDASRVVGCGITQDSYNSYGHRYWVNATITSPNGRSYSATSYTSATYVRIDVALSWDWDDVGEYVMSTTHSMTCSVKRRLVSSVLS